MANTPSRLKTYAISYGFTEGPAHSRHLRRLLNNAGLQPAPIEQADIILAHSSGCSFITSAAKPRLVVYVGMPLAQTRSRRTWLSATVQGAAKSQPNHTLRTRAKNLYHIVAQPRRNLRILYKPRVGLPVIFSRTPAVFIVNRYDPWPRSDQLAFYTVNKKHWSFIDLPGAHDDIWHHPERYVEIIDYYAGLLG